MGFHFLHTGHLPDDVFCDFIKNDDFHIILYNFKANSTCYIKNLQLCEDFCDSKVEEVYKKYLNIYYLKYNILGMLISIFVIM